MRYRHFTSDERLEISILLKKGYSFRAIGRAMGKNHSSISREIKNNSVNGIYDPRKAQHKAWIKRANSKYQGMKIRGHPKLEKYIRINMTNYWTPEQIAGRWNKVHAQKELIRIYAPSIYKYLYSLYGQTLCQYLPSKRYKRKPRVKNKQKKQLIPNRILIDKRPEIINKRKRLGDFEGDTLGSIKSDQQKVVGLVDRKSRYILLKKVRRLKYTIDGYKTLLRPYYHIIHSLTLDNAVEHVRYQELGVDSYFCHPYSSWERGTMENSFGRLRRFIPKKTSLKNYSNADIQGFQNIMNHTPRKCLNWNTPAEIFNHYDSS